MHWKARCALNNNYSNEVSMLHFNRRGNFLFLAFSKAFNAFEVLKILHPPEHPFTRFVSSPRLSSFYFFLFLSFFTSSVKCRSNRNSVNLNITTALSSPILIMRGFSRLLPRSYINLKIFAKLLVYFNITLILFIRENISFFKYLIIKNIFTFFRIIWGNNLYTRTDATSRKLKSHAFYVIITLRVILFICIEHFYKIT